MSEQIGRQFTRTLDTSGQDAAKIIRAGLEKPALILEPRCQIPIGCLMTAASLKLFEQHTFCSGLAFSAVGRPAAASLY